MEKGCQQIQRGWKREGDKFIVERVYYTPFPKSVRYVKAIVYESGEVEVVENRDYVTGCVYRML